MSAVLEQERKRREEENKMMSAIAFNGCVRALKSMNARYRSVPDVVAKHTLVLDKLMIMTDIMMSAMTIKMEDYTNQGCDVKGAEEVCNDIKKDLQELWEFVQHPAYSPEHPFGAQLMKKSGEHFDKKVEKIEKIEKIETKSI